VHHRSESKSIDGRLDSMSTHRWRKFSRQ
jgi:hypothetical protein